MKENKTNKQQVIKSVNIYQEPTINSIESIFNETFNYRDIIKKNEEKIDKLKDQFKIDDNLEYDKFEKECKNEINKFYEVDETHNSNIKKFVNYYFHNKFIDENNIDEMIIHELKLNNSILKKNM